MKIGEARTSPEVGKRDGKERTGERGCTVVVEEGTGAQGEVTRSRAGHVPTGCWGRVGGQAAARRSDEGAGGQGEPGCPATTAGWMLAGGAEGS